MLAADRSLLLFLAALDRHSVPYAIGGSVASGLHGDPRATHDADVLVDLTRERAAALVRDLRPAFYVDEEGLRAALKEKGSFNVIHVEAARKIDVFVAGDGGLDREQLERAVLVRMETSEGAVEIRVTSAEMMVLRKLDWFRRGGGESDRQWRDVLAILRVQRGRLDQEWLESEAAANGLTDLLRKAREVPSA